MIAERTSLTVALLGNPKKAATMDVDGSRYLVGSIAGIATGIKVKTSLDPKDGSTRTYEAIVGNFQGIPGEALTDSDGNVIDYYTSAMLYLPGGIHERLALALKAEGAKPIEFAIEVYAVKAKNPAGFTWEIQQAGETREADPLANARKMLLDKRKGNKAIAGPAAPKAK